MVIINIWSKKAGKFVPKGEALRRSSKFYLNRPVILVKFNIRYPDDFISNFGRFFASLSVLPLSLEMNGGEQSLSSYGNCKYAVVATVR